MADPALRGRALAAALSHATDEWLRALLLDALDGASPDTIALVAVGGYGRQELSPGSDLDVVLLHDGRRDIGRIAERLWYPVWDARLKLGHAVRTPKEALRLAEEDLDTATSFLALRCIAGDERMAASVAERSRVQWRQRSRRWLASLAAAIERRHGEQGEIAFLLEPDLKDGRGGLRDVHSLSWAEEAQLVLFPGDAGALDAAYERLLEVRIALHRRTGRRSDVLTLEEQDGVAADLGYASADALMRQVAGDARTIAWRSDEVWQRITATIEGPVGRAGRHDHPVASGVVLRDREVHLDSGADPADDPVLLLQVALAAARHRTRIERHTLERLAAGTPVWPDPWPAGAHEVFVALLLEGHHAIAPIESLDQYGLFERVLSEWSAVRNKPQRNAYHRFTVDRHLLEAAANAATFSHRVTRPDLLVVGALLHDIGKGVPGDHTEVGIGMVERIGHRMGFSHDDVEVLQAMVRHHLLLPDVATRRDLSDDSTIRAVADAVGSPLVLELLDRLTEADSLATGPSAWSAWKAELVHDLVARTAHVLGGGEVHEVAWSVFPTGEVLALMGAMRTAVRTQGDLLTVVAPDRPGLFSRVAGVLSLHGFDVLGAQAFSDEQGMAASEFRVAPPPEGRDEHRWERVRVDLEHALQGRLAIEARLAERARAYQRRTTGAASSPPPRVVVDNGASSNATVVEVHAPDAIGVLYRITRALADMGLDIRVAKVQTLGPQVVDAFYVRDVMGRKVTDPFHLRELERAVLHGVAATHERREPGTAPSAVHR